MTQKDKDLLLKDLCARLQYGVICNSAYIVADDVDGDDVEYNKEGKIESISNGKVFINSYPCDLDRTKPYLRPMSSLTGIELDECRETCKYRQVGQSVLDCATIDTFDWLNAHHFDYRGLIEKGLALEAPEGMYEKIIDEH